MDSTELHALLTSRLRTPLLSGTASRGPRPAPVSHENMTACIEALQKAFTGVDAMDADRVQIEAAIEASRPSPADDVEAKALHVHVQARYRALKHKAFSE